MSTMRTGATTGTETTRGRVRRQRPAWPVSVAIVVCLAACATLAACGTPVYPPNAFHQCGTVHEAAGRVLPGDAAAATAAENCFSQDYTNCQAATLTFTYMGVDTGSTRTFAENQISGKCVVHDTVQGYTANGGGSTFPAHTYTCSGLQQQADGLHITGCGADGDVLVPAPAAG